MTNIKAKITLIESISPTVKKLQLDISDIEYQYKPGQWLDLAIDNLNGIGGYSFTSSPLNRDFIELAIKKSEKHPVTRYIHEKLKEGDYVNISQGQGKIFYQDNDKNLVLIAGGIGITPLMSIFRYVNASSPSKEMHLLYSAKSTNDLVFMEEINKISHHNHNIKITYTITGNDSEWKGRRGRLNQELLVLSQFAPESEFFLCGPPAMIDTLDNVLLKLGFLPEQLKYEKWW